MLHSVVGTGPIEGELTAAIRVSQGQEGLLAGQLDTCSPWVGSGGKQRPLVQTQALTS